MNRKCEKEITLTEIEELEQKRFFCNRADFDAEFPYMEFVSNEPNDCDKRFKVKIPKSVAYYLSTHWCGSQKMHDLIESMAEERYKNQIEKLNKIKEILNS